MESHPIPQQISAYQFRLVGDMTLKQFFQLGGGALVSLLLYSTSLHPVIKWPLILFSFGLGAAMAFLPFEERPLGQWIISFFRAVYSPTIFVWSRPSTPYLFFKAEETAGEKSVLAPQAEPAVTEYLEKLPDEKFGFLSRLEEAEQALLSKVSGLLSFQPKTQPTLPSAVPPKKKKDKDDVVIPVTQPPQVAPAPSPTTVAQKGFRPKIVVEEKPLEEAVSQPQATATDVTPTLQTTEVKTKAAEFSPEASPPYPPGIPNTIVGQVIGPKGEIIEGAILEIRDLAGRPVRALRSNKVGHFIIVTSLPNGQYKIVTEKEGYVFDPVEFEARGDMIPPMAIRATKRVNIES